MKQNIQIELTNTTQPKLQYVTDQLNKKYCPFQPPGPIFHPYHPPRKNTIIPDGPNKMTKNTSRNGQYIEKTWKKY